MYHPATHSAPFPSASRLALAAACATLLLAADAGAAQPAQIKLNQVGFLPAAQKLAVVPGDAQARFAVVAADSGKPAFEGSLTEAATWDLSGERVRLADFSALRTPGSYRLRVAGLPDSAPFAIQPGVYRALDTAAIRNYTLNRSGIALTPAVAGAYARPLAHPDTRVLVHESAATKARPAGTVIASPKGWYDAGDYNKYIVNSGISTWTLLAAYEHFPDWFGKLALNLPESGNGLPDILNEALWNLDWMLTMQDPDDGGVYHKLTNKAFDGMVMPEQATAPRYVVQKTTAATLDFAAVMATAARVLAPFDAQAARSQRYLAAAERAWHWAEANPGVLYRQPQDIKTGEYGDKSVDDEFAWAAAELLITTGKPAYHARAFGYRPAAGETAPGWANVGMLGWLSLARHGERLPQGVDAAGVRKDLVALGDRLAGRWRASPYRITMAKEDFVWGSSSVILNQAMMLVAAYRIEPRPEYLHAAQSGLDYVLGRNGPGISFVTGFGARSPMHPHHRPSEADGIKAPVPGMLVGGPNPGQQDAKDCPAPYPSKLPALSWLDHMCSYASNEIAINWNAPLVYVAGALESLQR
ncbi:glycoside hydrolase family 9 protein [Massilia sp. IC2-477]|uniref:glycoside hydrolase family 9 protein n=1 Tax=Massilia sp. IC2-477 TaxID=2887198 RepID=UPI001D0FBCEF|nr:glycoside hydrolase family 9 protein [Massilia sp. IC2-477]MCC2957407.1 glycoside hydrolase family 9 protein [Massilia sp. IC2-477]